MAKLDFAALDFVDQFAVGVGVDKSETQAGFFLKITQKRFVTLGQLSGFFVADNAEAVLRCGNGVGGQ